MDINKKLFEDVVIYSIAEAGAMGGAGMMDFITQKGERFCLNYLDEKTPYAKIKENFPALKDCYWNGPMSEPQNSNEVILYGNNEDLCKHTRITKGWKHIYMGFGNHLVVREDKYKIFSEETSDLQTEIDIYDKWIDITVKLFKNDSR